MPPVDRHESLTIHTSWLAGKTIAFALTVAIPLLLVRRMPQDQVGLYKQIFLVINSAIRPFTSAIAPLVSLVVCGVAFTAVYAAVALLGGVLSADERAAITSNVRRATGRVPHVAALAVPIAVREN